MSEWLRTSVQRPCEVCGCPTRRRAKGWCSYTLDGAVWCGHVLEGSGIAPAGWRLVGEPGDGQVLRRVGDERRVDPELVEKMRAQRRATEHVKMARARERWNEALAAEDTDVAIRYLSRRGVPIHHFPAFDEEAAPGILPPTIVGVNAWTDEYYDEEKDAWVRLRGGMRDAWPAVICAFVDAEAHVTAIQQIFLDANDPSRKRDAVSPSGAQMPAKRQLGVMARGGAVRLGMNLDGGHLVICEGVETGALVACELKLPVWCCLSTGGLHRPGLTDAIVTPEGPVRRVTFAGDHDAWNEQLGARPGEHAARQAARALGVFDELEVALALPSHETAPTLIAADGEIKGA